MYHYRLSKWSKCMRNKEIPIQEWNMYFLGKRLKEINLK